MNNRKILARPGSSGFARITIIVIAAIVVLILAVCGVIYWGQKEAEPAVQPAFSPPARICSGEVKVCPDGTKVYPTGPKCELATCPKTDLVTEADILTELEKLNIKTAGPAAHGSLRLFPPSAGVASKLILSACETGGYKISLTSRIRTFTFTSYPIEEKYGNEPLDVRILSRGGKIHCVYKTVREGSTMAPGIFPAKEAAAPASPAPVQ